MKKLTLLLLSIALLNATEYFAKLQPFEKRTISAEVNGRVVFIDKTSEFSFVEKGKTVLKLDSLDERIELKTLRSSLDLQKELITIKEQNYKNKSKVRQLSQYDKNQEKLSLIEAKKSLEDIKRDLRAKEREIAKKEFFVENFYLDELLVTKDEYITAGSKLYSLYDFSKIKLEVFVRVGELQDLKNKKVFIDGELSSFVITKISSVRDEERVSTYKVILEKSNEDKSFHFGKIVKVEFK